MEHTDREKTIAEIREALEKATPGPWKGFYNGNIDFFNVPNGSYMFPADDIAPEELHVMENAPEWLRFLLSELDRIEQEYAAERAAHNAHVTELIEKEEECRKLREERDAYYNNAKYTEAAFREVISLRSQLQSAQQDREKLIEGLRWYADERRYQQSWYWKAGEYTSRARDILKDIGVKTE